MKDKLSDKITNPFAKLMGLRHKAHPWHGIEIGDDAPFVVTCFVEIVPIDTVKFEVDKLSGYLKIDRPQKFSNLIPALYGFIPQTYSGDKVAEVCRARLNRPEINGDGDPMDICILTEKEISHGDILVHARPIGGFRFIDMDDADDKIIAVLVDDAVYGGFREIADCPEAVIKRLKHYFLTYKDMPDEKRDCEITHTYGSEEAQDIIRRSMQDYRTYVEKLLFE
jgi:inorganic pyrophosphatase